MHGWEFEEGACAETLTFNRKVCKMIGRGQQVVFFSAGRVGKPTLHVSIEAYELSIWQASASHLLEGEGRLELSPHIHKSAKPLHAQDLHHRAARFDTPRSPNGNQ